MLPITSFYASLIAVVFLLLSARVIMYRRKNRLSLGDEGDKSLLKRMRAQANCAEYAPFALLLLALIEMTQTPNLIVHILGLMILAGRVLHGYGFSHSPPIMNFRVAGTALTLSMLALSAVILFLTALI